MVQCVVMNLIFGTGHEKEQMLYYIMRLDIDKEDWGCNQLSNACLFLHVIALLDVLSRLVLLHP